MDTMTNLHDIVTENKVEDLHSVVESVANSQKYLCFSRYSSSEEQFYICATDGCEIWRISLDQNDLETRRDLAKMNSMDAFLTKLRSGFQKGDIIVTETGYKLTLNIAKTLDFDLYESKAAEKKEEMKTVLFHLAESLTATKLQLKTANETVERLTQHKVGGTITLGQMESDQSKGKSKGQVKQVGMSAINPGSKKRKAAKGVVFD